MIRLPGAHADNLTMPAALLSRAPQVAHPTSMTESGASELTSPLIDDIFDT